jgi:hypothetical protein
MWFRDTRDLLYLFVAYKTCNNGISWMNVYNLGGTSMKQERNSFNHRVSGS